MKHLLRRLDLLDWLVLAILATCFVSLGWNRAHEVRAQAKPLEVEVVGGSSDGTPSPTGMCLKDTLIVPCGKQSQPSEPFDETPQEWATYEWQPGKMCDMGSCEDLWEPEFMHLEVIPHVGCVDPRRVLLSSEDGKKHCFAMWLLNSR